MPIYAKLEVCHAHVTNIGDRHSNQDSQAYAQRDDLGCFVIADGAGGHAGGEIASDIAVKAVIDSFLQELSFGVRALQFYVSQAIARVALVKRETDSPKDMSATIAALLIDQENRSAVWAHLGDTRIYLFRNRQLYSVTRDHSLVQQFVEAGYVPPDALRTHPQRSVLYAAVGAEGDAVPEITPEAVELQHGDAFLLCTDGFWEWITESEMESSLKIATSVEDWLRQMQIFITTNSNNLPKNRDNYTAQALWFIDHDAATRITNEFE